MADKQLTAQEERAIEEFLAELKNREQPQVVTVPPDTAVKFLMARKFDVSRAIDLFQAYRNTRLKEGIYNINPDEEPLRSELLSGKFTVLPGRDANGAALALFTARLHRPDVTTHKAVLQAIIYQLDKAIERVETQRNGLIFIYDMINSTYGNFDYELCVKILNLLKGAFPARLKCVFIVSSPLWFRAPFAVLRLFVREKLRERVRTVKAHELVNHIPKDSLPEHLGGTSKISHVAWIQACVNSRQGQENGDCMDHLFVIYSSEQNPKSRPLPADTEVSIHMPEEGGMTVLGLVQHVKRMKKRGIFQEYEEIRKEPPVSTFDVSKKPYNQSKNRYSDVLCLDQSRVKLGLIGTDETTDYINASFMDGYKRKNAYIATQGPLPKTFDDFWRMVWEQRVLIIVMTTRVIERGRIKCGQYWPLEAGRSEDSGHFIIRNIHIDLFQDFKLTHLDVYNKQTDESRSVAHYQYMSWPDFGVPKSASAMLDFRAQVKQHQAVAVQSLGSEWTGHPAGPPIVIHCSAGIGRTGTFCTLDICLSRLENIGTVDVLQTVKRMRTQRAFSIQTWDQYYFCYMAIIEYAQRKGLLAPVEWSDTEFETDSE
ncbi:PREDICTED: tyrosine-protein phosphatase non-receptor type 9-like isoform X2 [Nanorana parkeri]|uniref:tyrosine-protein phosphatase non-receptor type 9-like isoform X2 n=1 Tax=Nanorana parkeri TaxID=125878 RepID=UPI000854D13B|nr:PREDICTED: tyrosine-protein phosphatase non-receptor type 9-like isoform X2 [Nanorana parkeri]